MIRRWQLELRLGPATEAKQNAFHNWDDNCGSLSDTISTGKSESQNTCLTIIPEVSEVVRSFSSAMKHAALEKICQR